MSGLWEDNKARVNKLNLIGRLDYHGELSAQLQWQYEVDDRPIRIVYTTSGKPTAAVLLDESILVDHKLFWVTCKNLAEANYLVAIINSQSLYVAAAPFMSKGQFGPRDLHKHLWRLSIPEFDSCQSNSCCHR